MKLPGTFTRSKGHVNAYIETPKGSRNKYTFNERAAMLELSKILPAGTGFPLDFGFIPGTLGGDGDPLDIMVLNDSPSYPGYLLECRVIGILKLYQKEKRRKKERNDRVIAVPAKSIDKSGVSSLKEVNKNFLNEVVQFLKYYNEMEGKKLELLEMAGPKEALAVIKRSTRKEERR